MLSPAWASCMLLLNISTPVTTVLRVGLIPTTSTSVFRDIVPVSTLPVAAVPSPLDREHVFDRKQERALRGPLGLWDVIVHGLHQLPQGLPSSPSSPSSARKAAPTTTGTSSPGK